MIEHYVGKTECPRCGRKADKYIKPSTNNTKEIIIYCSNCSFEKHYNEDIKEVK